MHIYKTVAVATKIKPGSELLLISVSKVIANGRKAEQLRMHTSCILI